MADPNTRQGKRTPVTLKIKFKSETLEQFIERYAVDVSQGGIFIRTKEPLAVGTQMKFEFQLRDASPLIAGEGTVVWTRENDPSRPAIAPGMGVRFDKLAEGSQAVLEKILAEKQKQAPSRGGSEATTKPPMFTDTPTKVAPAPVQEALGVGRSGGRRREDSEQTPLPKPMPFHSDAEDFDERAFEEATKVRSLDELAAQTAGDEGAAPPPADDTKTATKLMPPDELAARRQQGRADSTLADPPMTEPPAEAFGAKAMPDRDSAPGLPPSPDGPRPRMLGNDKGEEFASRTLAGHEPAKAATSARMKADSSGARALASETPLPAAPKRPSSAPIIVGILLVVIGAIVAIYFLFLKENTQEVATDKGSAAVTPDKGSAVVTNTGSAGSAGGTTMATGSNAGSAEQGSASTGSGGGVTMAAGSASHPVDTVIAASVAKGATVAIEGTDMTGPAPFTAKLEKDKEYKAKVSAPGFVAQEIDVKGGQKEITAKLVAKPKQISVTSTPAGADIAIDGALTGKQTPADITLSATQAARAKVHVTLRHAGYRPLDQIVDASTFTEDDAKLSASINATLTIAPKIVPNNNGGGTTTTNNNAGSGATTPTGTGTGSAATPTGSGTGTTGTGTGTGTGSASGTSGGSTTTPTPATTPPAGGTTGTTAPSPAGGTSGSASSSGQVLK